MKKTLVLGATPNPSRYAYTATTRLQQNGHETIPVGIKKGNINGLKIQNGQPPIENIHTITLYLNPKHQVQYYNYILSLLPERIIFNPGTENNELRELATSKGIHTENACTLVLLSTGEY